MSVHIFKNHSEFSYDTERPIEEQIIGSDKILIDFKENDFAIEHFLNEVEKVSKTSFGFGLNIQVINNNLLNGARAKKRTLSASENLAINDIISLMVNMHYNTDKKLFELAKICVGNK